MKNKKVQNIIIFSVVGTIIAGIIIYNYSAEQTRQKGFVFGNDLEKIQNEVKDLQTEFYSKKTEWEEGTITQNELYKHYDYHVKRFEEIISKYDNLLPPESFKPAVELLKLSSETQLDSDKQFIEWVKTGDESFKIRSDSQFQQALEYEMSGLVEYYSAKTGVKP